MSSVTYAALSDRGRVRQINEDRWFADPERGIYIVADGMGGAAAGELAAEAVTTVLPRLLSQRFSSEEAFDERRAPQQVMAAIREMSDHLRDEARQRPAISGMGATVVVALIRPQQTVVAHLGDSRAYLLRGGILTQLTRDHSIIQLLLDSGEITAEEAAAHPARGRITRFVGMQDDSLPEGRFVEFAPSDRLVLCTDGLTGVVPDRQLCEILNGQPHIETACRELVAAANEAGGQDNITVLIVAQGEPDL
jgi:protein phosphatase